MVNMTWYKEKSMSINYDEMRIYKDRIRIFFIIYFFAEKYNEIEHIDCTKVLRTEVKIQKLDFLIRNPDYLCYELLDICDRQDVNRDEIKAIIKRIFNTQEPQIRRLEMERFFFGAYEDIDNIIAFLVSVGFLEFTTERNIALRVVEKCYYVTKLADDKMKQHLPHGSSLNWYVDRCFLIKKFFGDYSGTDLKNLQYKIPQYKNTTYRENIRNIDELVKEKYDKEFGESLWIRILRTY